MKKGLIIAAFALLSVTACKKNIETVPTENESAKSFKEIKSDESFNWETEHNLMVKVQGLETPTKIVNTFKISSPDGQTIYLSPLKAMDQSWEENIRIPQHVTEIKVSFGSIVKSFKTSHSNIQFDYLSENVEEVLE